MRRLNHDSACVQVITCKVFGAMTVSRSKSPPGPPAATTHQRLLDAARAEFGASGIECATTRAIAERAGFNEVTLFRHFESKQKLLEAVVQDTSEEFRELCECRENLSPDLRAALRHVAEVYSRSLERCEGMMRALIGEGRRRPQLVRELVGDVLKPLHDRIASYLDAQARAGTVRPDVRSREFAEIFTSTLMGGLLRRTSGLSEMTRDGWIEQTVELLVRGVEAGR